MGFKIDGLGELQKQLKKMKRAAKELEGKNEVPLDQACNAQFMRKYTDFESFNDFLSAGGFDAQTTEEFEAIPEDALDQHTRKTTKFSSWEEMLGKAHEEYIVKKLGF